ncbi:MAG TPA: M15 family metallopeptidase [Thermoanaerobaculia bacterium]|nr:M15 family metallopeptidase [Thermoanaerobaculia bacterium]
MRHPSRLAVALFVLLLAALPGAAQEHPLPPGFVDLAQAVPGIELEIRYAGSHNFVGAPIDGYVRPRALLSHLAAAALAKAQEELRPFGFGLKVFDAYRPQRAVDHFVRWSKDPADLKGKAEFYPKVEKDKLFELGYIAEKSGHSRGSTVDLTLIVLADGSELDMGSPYDLFDSVSWPDSTSVSPAQRAHRLLLREAMLRAGFKPYAQEWWHFTLDNEPFPETYFDFPVE